MAGVCSRRAPHRLLRGLLPCLLMGLMMYLLMLPSLARAVAVLGSDMNLQGGAQVVNGNQLRLTNIGAKNTASSAWRTTTASTTANFSTTFSFTITGNPEHGDGFAFAMHSKSNTLTGWDGGNMGLSPDFNNYAALTFRTFDYNTLGLALNGYSGTASPTKMSTCASVSGTATVSYNVSTEIMSLSGTLTTSCAGSFPIAQSMPVNLKFHLGSPTMVVGFTGGTGGTTSQVTITSHSFTQATGPARLQISASSASGVTCAPTTFTVKACADTACSSVYTGGVSGSLASNHASWLWPGGSGFSIPAGSSQTTVVGRLPVVGTATLSVASSTPTAANAATCNFGGATNCGFSASAAGFVLGLANHRAETSTPLTVQAVRSSDSSASACTPAWANVTRNITLACSYANPSTGTLPLRVGGNAVNATANANAACGSRSFSLTFDSSGTAKANVLYADVGRLGVSASYSGSAATSDSGLSMTGSTNVVVAPTDFAFSALPSGALVAGIGFDFALSARNALGNTTPNFGKETSPERATVTLARRSPTGVGASDGTFGAPTLAWSNGVGSASGATWSEVGTADLLATLVSGSYLGTGLNASGSTGSAGALGPFRPHNYLLVPTPACGSFSYAGQPVNVTVFARNASGATTVNLDGSARTSPNYARQLTFSEAVPLAAGTGSFTAANLPASAFLAGVARGTLQYSFTNKQTVPQSLKLRVTDADGVGSAATADVEPVLALRSGRLQLQAAAGSAGVTLSLPVRAEYWSPQGAWLVNTADTCTTLSAAHVALGPRTTPAGAQAFWSNTVSASLTNGLGSVQLGPPQGSNNNLGSVYVALNLGASSSDRACLPALRPGSTGAQQPWLRSLQGSAHGCNARQDSDPSARASFGAASPQNPGKVFEREY